MSIPGSNTKGYQTGRRQASTPATKPSARISNPRLQELLDKQAKLSQKRNGTVSPFPTVKSPA